MEKFSKWRDPSTGIQPFLPLQAPASSPLTLAVLPFSLAFALVRAALLAVLLGVYFILVEILLTPLGAIGRPLSSLFTSILARTALVLLGYYSIAIETASAKRGGMKAVAQVVPSAPRRGDLIISNWTSYIDVLYYAFRHNPTFLLPVFSEAITVDSNFGRASGTGSASILLPTTSSTCIGYVPVRPLALMARTGSLPPTAAEVAGQKVFKTLAAARAASPGPVLVFPEGTTSNGRAVLRFGDGVLGEEVGKEGIVWIKFMRHASPTALLAAASCPLPNLAAHLRAFLTSLPLPRSVAVRTLHPSASPSSPSFLPSEVLASQPGGFGALRDDHTAANREACAVILAETGRVRRVPGMGWAEKASFLVYYAKSKRQ